MNVLCSSGKIKGWYFIPEWRKHWLYQCLLYHGKSDRRIQAFLNVSVCWDWRNYKLNQKVVTGAQLYSSLRLISRHETCPSERLHFFPQGSDLANHNTPALASPASRTLALWIRSTVLTLQGRLIWESESLKIEHCCFAFWFSVRDVSISMTVEWPYYFRTVSKEVGFRWKVSLPTPKPLFSLSSRWIIPMHIYAWKGSHVIVT